MARRSNAPGASAFVPKDMIFVVMPVPMADSDSEV